MNGLDGFGVQGPFRLEGFVLTPFRCTFAEPRLRAWDLRFPEDVGFWLQDLGV